MPATTALRRLRWRSAASSVARSKQPKPPAPRSGAALHEPSLAVLIDGDNASPDCIPWLMQDVSRRGNVSLARIYGNWRKSYFDGYISWLSKYNIQTSQAYDFKYRMNTTDMAMVVDAMDLLHTGRYSAFCLVTGDSDFRPLVSRIRQQGIAAHGYGEHNSSRALMAACTTFTVLQTPSTDELTTDINASGVQEGLATTNRPIYGQLSTAQLQATDIALKEPMLIHAHDRNMLHNSDHELQGDLPVNSNSEALTLNSFPSPITGSAASLAPNVINSFELHTEHGKEFIRCATTSRLGTTAHRTLPFLQLNDDHLTSNARPIDETALSAIRSSLADLGVSETRFHRLSHLAEHLQTHHPMVRPDAYGHRRIRSFFAASGLVRMGIIEINDRPDTLLVGLAVQSISSLDSPARITDPAAVLSIGQSHFASVSTELKLSGASPADRRETLPVSSQEVAIVIPPSSNTGARETVELEYFKMGGNEFFLDMTNGYRSKPFSRMLHFLPYEPDAPVHGRPLDGLAMTALNVVFKHMGITETNFGKLAQFSQWMYEWYPRLNARAYGFRTFRDFLVASGQARVGDVSTDGIGSLTILSRLPKAPVDLSDAASYASKIKGHGEVATSPQDSTTSIGNSCTSEFIEFGDEERPKVRIDAPQAMYHGGLREQLDPFCVVGSESGGALPERMPDTPADTTLTTSMLVHESNQLADGSMSGLDALQLACDSARLLKTKTVEGTV